MRVSLNATFGLPNAHLHPYSRSNLYQNEIKLFNEIETAEYLFDLNTHGCVNVKMKLAHAVGDQLFRVRVVDDPESGVLFHEAIDALREVVIVLRVNRLDGHRHNRIGYEHGLHRQAELFFGDKRVSGRAVDAEQGANVASKRLFNVLKKRHSRSFNLKSKLKAKK